MAGYARNHLDQGGGRGKEVWEFDTGQPATSASFMALVDGTIYLVSDDGKLMAISD